MAHDVFISYSMKDKRTADAACAALELAGIRCWFAPRDVPAGTSWPSAILGAIGQSRVMLLIFSAHAIDSEEVQREVGHAFRNRVVVVPFRIEDVPPSGDMAYFISTTHWLDAMAPPLEAHLQRLCQTVRALIPTLHRAAEPEPRPAAQAAPQSPPSEPKARTVTVPKAYDSGLTSVRATQPDSLRQKPKELTSEATGTFVGTRAGQTRDDNSLKTKLVWIPAGEFQMGAADGEEKAGSDEKPQHRVRITKPFYLGTYEVTQGEFERVMGRNPSYFSTRGGGKEKVSGQDTSRFPVEQVSWYDAVEFCNKLSESENRPPYYRMTKVGRNDDGSIKTADVAEAGGNGYRLPTEAEWEYACRAGTTTPFHFGTALNGTQANSHGNDPYGTTERGQYLKRPTTVGSYKPNAFGLYDMHGNVWEWCWDWYDAGYYKNSPESDPAGPSEGSGRVVRGGTWYTFAVRCRAASRGWSSPDYRFRDLGFRLARSSGE
jgi:formylglycine-generating enzyme required for sulfatase activity